MHDNKLIVIGAGGHARACIDVIEQVGRYELFGLIGTLDELGSTRFGYEVIGTDEALRGLRKQCRNAIVGIGQIEPNTLRTRIFVTLQELNFELPSIISPYAYVSRHAEIGSGTIVMHGATVNAGASIGNNCIVNSHALVEHDVTVHDHCHISTGVILNGSAEVGEGSFVGSGSVVREGISIAANSLVGMLSAVKRRQN